MTDHFLVITDDGRDGSNIHGIYPTFELARDETERRIAEDEAREYAQEYISRAEIQQWSGENMIALWERRYNAPLDWQKRSW